MKRVSAFMPSERQPVLQVLCEALFVPTSNRPDRAVFPCVEAAEAIRDSFPGECASIMADLLPHVDPRIRQGFFLCLSEGYQAFYRGVPQRSAPEFHFRGPAQAVFNPASDHPLDVFGDRVAQAFSGDPEDAALMRWFNGRLTNCVITPRGTFAPRPRRPDR
jgi:hypothetical protein